MSATTAPGDSPASAPTAPTPYFESRHTVTVPPLWRTALSRLAFPLLAVLSRESSLRLGLTPIDDERVIMALKHVRGRVLDIGCGSNTFVRSYGNGVGADVVNWDGCDVVLEDAANLPFPDASFDTVSYLACLNHITNRDDSVREARRVLRDGGRLLVTMIPPRIGAFVHWLRERNDPDHKQRHIDHAHELMGMSPAHVRRVLEQAGFVNIRRRRFVFGTNSIYIAEKHDG